jgi:ATP-dependent protease ClpP protease subunit
MDYILNQKIGERTLNDLIDFVENHRGDKRILIDCEGGEVVYMEMMRDIIEAHQIDLVVFGKCFSSAFELYYSSKVEGKRILKNAIFMYHLSVCTITINEKGVAVYHEDLARKQYMKNMLDRTKDFMYAINMNEKEIKQVLKGNEVYFLYYRAIKLNSQMFKQC